MQRGNIRGGAAGPKERNGHRRRDKGQITLSDVVRLVVLLVWPGLALMRLCPPLDFRWILGYWFAVSVFTYGLYREDKRRAETGRWRISESTLHLAELIGGWPAAFFAQREFNHKISKHNYQTTFWMIVTLYQIVACDFMLHWTLTRSVWDFIRGWVS